MATALRKPPVESVEQVLDAMDASRNIAQRIAAVMGEVDYVQKEKKSGMNYSIVSHDAVTAKVRPLLHKHGVIYYPRALAVSQNGNRTEAVFTVRFENIDNRDDYIDVETFGYGVDPQDKGPGKAMSYGVKYALLKVLGLETGDDPDTVQDNRADHQPRANWRITQDQEDELRAMASEVGADVSRFCGYLKIKELSDLPAGRYADAVKALEAKRQKEPA